jgi:hypothetical protein
LDRNKPQGWTIPIEKSSQAPSAWTADRQATKTP